MAFSDRRGRDRARKMDVGIAVDQRATKRGRYSSNRSKNFGFFKVISP